MVDQSALHREDIRDWLVERIAAEINVTPEQISVDETFFNLGLNSLKTLILSGEIAEFLNREDFNPSLFWDYPTIEKLSEHLSEPASMKA